jgi:2-oxo-4-hydroxy-4-carboxy-5-ureidoimidazoline decarboxylase
MTLDELNRLTPQDAWTAFERCCGASAWVEHMCAHRPYADRAALLAAAATAEARLEAADWREAFAHHPRIGDVASLRERFASTADWAAGEQRGASAAAADTLEALAEANRDYERRFGTVFIVCATGKTGAEMLALLRERMPNDPAAELAVAAGEQRKITRLRLDKLLADNTRGPADPARPA